MLKKISKSTILVAGLFSLSFANCNAAGSDAASSAATMTMFGAIFGFWVVWMIIVGTLSILNILGIILWVWMIVDVAKREFKNENDKLMWLLIVVLTGWIGALIYYFYVKRKEDNK